MNWVTKDNGIFHLMIGYKIVFSVKWVLYMELSHYIKQMRKYLFDVKFTHIN